MDTDKLIKALKWREEVASGEMIVSQSYQKNYMGYHNVSQQTLDDICVAANAWWRRRGSNLRIANDMGEIIPAIYSSYEKEVKMPDFNELSRNVDKLKSLLDARQEGLFTWCMSTANVWKEIVEMWGDEQVDSPDTNKVANHQEGVCVTCGRWVIACKCRRI